MPSEAFRRLLGQGVPASAVGSHAGWAITSAPQARSTRSVAGTERPPDGAVFSITISPVMQLSGAHG